MEDSSDLMKEVVDKSDESCQEIKDLHKSTTRGYHSTKRTKMDPLAMANKRREKKHLLSLRREKLRKLD